MQLARADSATRLVLGHLANRFIEKRGCERLGFARLDDYCAERLGWSARQIQDIARVAAALGRLPEIDRAFRCGAVGWSKVRLLASVSSPADESNWLAVALSVDARTLASITANARAAAREQRHLAAASVAPASDAGAPAQSTGAPSRDADGGHRSSWDSDAEEEEDRILLRIECSKRARRMWNDARRLAPQMAGRTLAQWQVAELVAAEASAAPGPFRDVWEADPWRKFSPAEGLEEQPRSRAEPALDGARERCDVFREERAPGSPLPATADGRSDIPYAEVSGSSLHGHVVDLSGEAPSERAAPSQSGASAPEPDDDHAFASPVDSELVKLDELDVFELDAAMRRVRGAMQQRQSKLGVALGLFLDLRLHVQLGYASAADYVRERLGMADRTARDFVRVAQAAGGKSPLLAEAYASGELSWLRVLTLLPVVRPWNAQAWTKRAGEVTIRRLADEVAWVAGRIDSAPEFAGAVPPPLGARLEWNEGDRRMCAHGGRGEDDEDRRMCAHGGRGEDDEDDEDRRMCEHGGRGEDDAGRYGHGARHADPSEEAPVRPGSRSHEDLFGVTGRIHVTFAAPLSVGVLFRTVLQGFAHPTEPRWLAFERMLEHVLSQWRSQPRHRDPVFARDGYRCTAPGCNSFTNLHDHHVVPRSAGGSNEMNNRTTLCAWHHLRAVHGGLARATGEAPDALNWELGLADGQAPLMRFHGDRYADEAR